MILVNGQPADSISVNDRGLQFGDGVFETIAVIQGRPLCLEEHLQRLLTGCERLSIHDVDQKHVTADIERACSAKQDAVVKVIITRGESVRGYGIPAQISCTRIVYSSEWPEEATSDFSRGMTVCLCNTRLGQNPALAGIKHLNRLEQVIARREVTLKGCDEGVMLDTSGNVVEGTMSNLFIVADETLVTPELSNCGIAGVIRGHILNAAATAGIKSEIRPVLKEELASASELFFSNSLAGLRWARRFDGRSFGAPDTATVLRTSLINNHAIRPDK